MKKINPYIKRRDETPKKREKEARRMNEVKKSAHGEKERGEEQPAHQRRNLKGKREGKRRKEKEREGKRRKEKERKKNARRMNEVKMREGGTGRKKEIGRKSNDLNKQRQNEMK